MELKDLTGAMLILILTAILIGVGITILGNLSREVRTDATYTNDRFNATNASCTTLTNTFITSSTASFRNATDGQTLSTSCFTWDNSVRRSGSCVQLATATACNVYHYRFVNVTYTYGAATGASNGVDNTSTAIGTVPNWFTVLVVIIAAAIVIGVVSRSFGSGKIE